MATFCMIDDEVYPTDTLEDINIAQQALVTAGWPAVAIIAGDTACPDAYPNGQILYAPLGG